MHTMQHAAGHKRATLTLDWSSVFRADADATEKPSFDVHQLIAWVESYPRKSQLAFRLRAPHRNQLSFTLKRTLQSLGCTVIAHYWFPARSHVAQA